MKKQILLTVFSMLILAGPVYGQMPEVEVEDGKGETIGFRTLAEHKVPLLVSFWSTTCKPCIAELNAVNDALEEWREQAEFEVVAVSTTYVRRRRPVPLRAATAGMHSLSSMTRTRSLCAP